MRISVIIPNWNGAHLLPVCLESLRRQTHRDFNIVLVDNASTDDSPDLVARLYPDVKFVQMGRNAGFTGAVNEGIRQSDGDVVAILNNDTEADVRWLAELDRAFAEHPDVSFCASKLLLFDRRDTIHSAGDFYGIDGVPGNRGVWQKDVGQFDQSFDVFGACGGAAAYRRTLFDEIGLFDEDYWMYCEDVDLNLRARLAGHSCRFVPTAVVYHMLSASGGGSLASYYCGRNFIEVAVKNLPKDTLRLHWPGIVRAQLGFTVQSIVHFREAAARARLRGQFAALRRLPDTLRRRRVAVARHQIDAITFESLLER